MQDHTETHNNTVRMLPTNKTETDRDCTTETRNSVVADKPRDAFVQM